MDNYDNYQRPKTVDCRKSTTGPAIVKLGGAWAKMSEHTETQAAQIAELKNQLAQVQARLDSREVALSAFKEANRLSEEALAEERGRVADAERRLSEERTLREEEQKRQTEEMLNVHKRLAQLEANVTKATRECQEAREAQRSAEVSEQYANKEKDRAEEELRLLVARVEEAESSCEKLTAENEELRANMDQTARQRNNHQAHAELLLKEKNRLGAEMARIKKDAEEKGAAVQRPQSARTPLQDRSGNSKAQGKRNLLDKPAPTQQALRAVELERDTLARRVHRLEKDNDDLLVRFRSASQARTKLEKDLKKTTTSTYRESSARPLSAAGRQSPAAASTDTPIEVYAD